MSDDSSFQVVFEELKKILVPYGKKLVLENDEIDNYYVNTSFIMKNKKPMYFGSVKINKSYVSFHLMPVYIFPSLIESISPELKRRMQGKSCFNFVSIDMALFKELKGLVGDGYLQYERQGYL